MRLYHGTDRNAAQNIVGPPPNVDVTLGGGELGQGFYMGDSLALAISWAKGRYASQGCVVEADIDELVYAQLIVKTLNHAAVLNTWTQLRYNGTESTFRFGVDVVYGPLATYPHVAQHKFESSYYAQNALNRDPTIWRIL